VEAFEVKPLPGETSGAGIAVAKRTPIAAWGQVEQAGENVPSAASATGTA
jgi:hypothetical protein